MLIRRFGIGFALLMAAIAACSSEATSSSSATSSGGASATSSSSASATSSSSGTGGMFPAGGPVTGAPVPADAVVAVAWDVSSGSPDYLYKFGDGASTGATWMVSFSSDPPPAAINSYGVGVGFVLLFPKGTTIPDGMVADAAALLAMAIGGSLQHAIIWRDASKPGLPWSGAFPAGFACGQCVSGGGGFDSFTPVECSKVEVVLGPPGKNFCNWT